MNLKRVPMEFQNVIVKDISEKGLSLQDISEVKLNALYQGVFTTGPILVEGKWGKGYQKLMIPVNTEIEFKEHTGFSFLEKLRLDDGIYYRNGEEDFSELPVRSIMDKIANDLNVHLSDTYYCIILNVYGGKLYDIYVPVKSEEQND